MNSPSVHTRKHKPKRLLDTSKNIFNKTFHTGKEAMSAMAHICTQVAKDQPFNTTFLVLLGLCSGPVWGMVAFESFKSKKDKKNVEQINTLFNKQSKGIHLTTKEIEFVNSHASAYFSHYVNTRTEMMYRMYFYTTHKMKLPGDLLTHAEKEYVESHAAEYPQSYIALRRKISHEIKLHKKKKSNKTQPTFAQFREHIRDMEYISSWRPSEDKFLDDNRAMIDKIAKWFDECHNLDKQLSAKDVQFKKQHQHMIDLYCEYMINKMEQFEKRYEHDSYHKWSIIELRFSVDGLCSLRDWDPTFTWQTVDSWSRMIVPSGCKRAIIYTDDAPNRRHPSTNISAVLGASSIIWKGTRYVSSPMITQVLLIEGNKNPCRLYLFSNDTSREYFEEHELPQILNDKTDYKKSRVIYTMRELKKGKKTIVQIYAPKGFVK